MQAEKDMDKIIAGALLGFYLILDKRGYKITWGEYVQLIKYSVTHPTSSYSQQSED